MKYTLSTISIVLFPLLFCACGADATTSPTPQACTAEVCDLLDNDCDGLIDEGNSQETSPAPAPWYRDADQDGWGDSAVQCDAETAGTGWSLRAGDCNEADQSIHPDAYEYCNDGIDRNCDGRPTRCGIYGEMALSDAGATIVGEVAGHSFGNIARLPADFDQDGFSDLTISSAWSTTVYYGGDIPQDISGEGEFWLHPGPLFGTVMSSDLAEHFLGPYIEASLGSEIQAGDLTGDGIPELILGSRGGQSARQYDNQGIIYIFFGPIESGLSLTDADVRLLGDNEGDRLGSAIATPADSDGDGIFDLFAASCCTHLGQEYEVGAAYRFGSPLVPGDLFARNATLQIQGEEAVSSFANECAISQDSNGDGIPDLGVSEPWSSSFACQAGVYYLFFGSKYGIVSARDADASLRGLEIGELFGASASLAGDVIPITIDSARLEPSPAWRERAG